MKLWILSFADGFDSHDGTGKYPVLGYTHIQGFVIRAESEAKAREIAAGESKYTSGPWWLDHEVATCTELLPDGDAGIVLANEPTG